MPWTPKTFASRHNKRLSGKGARMASDIANSVLERTGDEGLAIREASGVAKKRGYATGGAVGEMQRAYGSASKGNHRLARSPRGGRT